MDLNRILIEYAKLSLQLIVANEAIASLQTQIKTLQIPAEPSVSPSQS